MYEELVKDLRHSQNFNFVNYGYGVKTTEILAADALEAADKALADCRNELCQRCGQYKRAHLGYCDGCRWKKGE